MSRKDAPVTEQRSERRAELYDWFSSEFYDHHAIRDDLDFYLSYAVNTPGSILELGCGTGRILVPIAGTGKRITGLDRSDGMLKICQGKIDRLQAEVRGRVRLVRADIRRFDLHEKFSLALIPFGPFNCLPDTGDQISCLNCVREHLDDDGSLVFDVWYPKHEELRMSEHGYHVVKDQPHFEMPDGRRVQWGIFNASVDYNRQLIHEEMYYDIDYPGGRKERLIYPSPVSYFYRYEIEHLLARTGFRIAGLYRDFHKNEFGDQYPSELIVEAVRQ